MCDTVCALTRDGVLFGKNSDRDANEAQVLEWLPRTASTAAALISRPIWMDGAEIGANEHGVAIGNEAVFTRAPVPPEGRTGMDHLRTALERARSAHDAVQVLVSEVEADGQGGPMGFEDPSFRYSSSFLVADAREAWVVETAGRAHAEERVTGGVRTISNVLSIPGFAERWSDRLKTTVAAGRIRRARTAAAIGGARGVEDVMRALRDTGDGGPTYSFWNGTCAAPCMHGGGVLAASVTTASWVSLLRPGRAEHWVTATSAPDLALYKPVRVDEPLDLGAPGARWWRFERVHRAWLRDPAEIGARFLAERDAVQARWLADPPEPAAAFAEDDALVERWIAAAEGPRAGRDVRPWYARRYWTLRG